MSPVCFAVLSRLSALQTFEMDGDGTCRVNELALLSFMSALTSLRELTLSNWKNALTEVHVAQWTRLSSLKTLALISCTGINSGILAAIARLSGLRDLNLQDTCFRDEGAGHLTALTALSGLHLTGVSSECVQLFSNIKGLKLEFTDFEESDESYHGSDYFGHYNPFGYPDTDFSS